MSSPKRFQIQVRPRNEPGKLEALTLEAEDLEAVIAKLHQDGYLIVWIKPLADGKGPFGLFGKRKTEGDQEEKTKSAVLKTPRFHILPAVKTPELISFAVQLSALLQAGVPLVRSLQTTQKGTKNDYFKTVLGRCIEEVRSGFSLSHALIQFPKVFPPIWGNLIEVGEASGNLPEVLSDVAAYQEAAQRVKNKVISALFYPCILVVLATSAVTFLMLKIIPQFATMFQGLDLELPLITKIVVNISNLVRSYFPLIAFCAIAGVIGILAGVRTPQGRFIFDLVRLKMPIMGSLVLQVSMVRFARGLGTMIRAGVPILKGMEISGKLVQNKVVETAIAESREAVQAGRNLGAELERRGLFPAFMTQLVTVGEESGELERFLKLVANYYEERIDTFLGRLTTLIEPVLLVAVGSMIGVVAVSMILPIIEISTKAH